MKKFLIASAVAALATASQANAATNLLTNGSFENGLTGWTQTNNYSTGGGTQTVQVISYNSTTNGASGESVPFDNAASRSPDAVGSFAAYFVSDNANPQSLYQTLSLVAGQAYDVGFDWYVPFNGSRNANSGSMIVTLNGTTIGTIEASADNAGTWRTVNRTVTFTASASGDYKLGFTSGQQPAKDFVIDRAYVTAVPEPATWGMMLLGFAMVGGAARYRRRGSAVVYS